MKPAPIIPIRSVFSGLRWAMVSPSSATNASRHYGTSQERRHSGRDPQLASMAARGGSHLE